jgi:hypothetical protein
MANFCSDNVSFMFHYKRGNCMEKSLHYDASYIPQIQDTSLEYDQCSVKGTQYESALGIHKQWPLGRKKKCRRKKLKTADEST